MKSTQEEFELFYNLPPRVKKVLVYLAEGKELDEIAKARHLTYESVRQYLLKAYLRTGINRRVALAVFIVRRPEIEKMLREAL
jgi:DNA-binding NarL/FixJ family response regulator